MTTEQAELYSKIRHFQFDEPGTCVTFATRLSMENDWHADYVIRVVTEYRRFIFLAIVSEHPVTPSDQVDQVWHLHLQSTRSYWDRFCNQTLQQHLHHTPTQGGADELEKYVAWYENTLESYRMFFGCGAPVDIWPVTTERFNQIHFVRVNRDNSWIVSKVIWRNAVAAVRSFFELGGARD